MPLNSASVEKIDKDVNAWIEEYKLNNKQAPSGKDISAYRNRVELQYIGLSELIRKMLKIGNPEALDAPRGSKDEFERLASEIDRREQMYLQRA